MLLLSRCTFMTATHDFEEVDKGDIQEILDNANDGAEMLEVLRRVKFPLDSGKTLAERKKYYETLVDIAAGLAETKYSKEDKEICVAVLLKGRWLDEEEIFDYCKSISDKYLDNDTGLSDEIWFLLEKLSYDLLAKQAGGDKWDFDYIKGFVAKLKQGKERFEKLSAEYDW